MFINQLLVFYSYKNTCLIFKIPLAMEHKLEVTSINPEISVISFMRFHHNCEL